MKRFTPFIAFIAFPTLVWAKTVYVYDVDASGDPALKAPVQDLIRTAVAGEKGYEVVNSVEGSELQLRPKLMKLGNSYLLTVDKSLGAKLLYSAKMKATNADDLDTVAGRVVRSALHQVEARESAKVDDVTRDEVTRGTNRFEAIGQFKLGLGPAWGVDMNTKATGTHFQLGYNWGIDPQWDVDVAWNYTGLSKSGETGASFNDFAIGASYNFSRDRNAPYVTVGFGRAMASVSSANTGLFNFSSERANGWSGHVGGGYKFFRTSSVNFALEATYTQIFAETTNGMNSPGVINTAIVLLF